MSDNKARDDVVLTTLVLALINVSAVRLEPEAYRGHNRAPPNRRSLITPPSAGDKQRHNPDLMQWGKLHSAFAVNTPSMVHASTERPVWLDPTHALSIVEAACYDGGIPHGSPPHAVPHDPSTCYQTLGRHS